MAEKKEDETLLLSEQDKIVKMRANAVAIVKLVVFAVMILMIVAYSDDTAGNVIYYFSFDEVFVATVGILFAGSKLSESHLKVNYLETYMALCMLNALLCAVEAVFRTRRLVKSINAEAGSELRLFFFPELVGAVVVLAFFVSNIFGYAYGAQAKTHVRRIWAAQPPAK